LTTCLFYLRVCTGGAELSANRVCQFPNLCPSQDRSKNECAPLQAKRSTSRPLGKSNPGGALGAFSHASVGATAAKATGRRFGGFSSRASSPCWPTPWIRSPWTSSCSTSSRGTAERERGGRRGYSWRGRTSTSGRCGGGSRWRGGGACCRSAQSEELWLWQ
jgi:hypothetical protein